MESKIRIVAIFLMLTSVVINGELVDDQQAEGSLMDLKGATDWLMKAANSSTDLKDLLKKGLTAIVDSVDESMAKTVGLKNLTRDKMIIQAIDICGQLQQDSIDSVLRSVDRVGEFDPARADEFIEDIKIWVGGVFSDQMACKAGFSETPGQFGKKMKIFLEKARKLTTSAFDVIDQMAEALVGPQPAARPLEAGMRRLMAVNMADTKPNVVVAKDGTGKYKTINEAIADIPPNNVNAFVIYVKAGVYVETVNFEKEKKNVVLFGDGPTKTRVSGKLSNTGGVQTFKTATVAIMGDDFLCRDIGFENTAGPEGHQAVALRVQGDRAVFLNCAMDGFQDTLYAQKFRQFYRDCTISGTVDYIFGDAAAVFQNCRMIVRKPGPGQNCFVTAQGRETPRNPTGYVLQNCNIVPQPGLAGVGAEFQVYLGRPWRQYARTLYIQCEIPGIVDPAGWAEWEGTTNMETCYYAEFGNRGPGAALDKRVIWKGYQRITMQIAQDYVPAKFLLGDTWIPQTGVPYFPGWIAV